MRDVTIQPVVKKKTLQIVQGSGRSILGSTVPATIIPKVRRASSVVSRMGTQLEKQSAILRAREKYARRKTSGAIGHRPDTGSLDSGRHFLRKLMCNSEVRSLWRHSSAGYSSGF